MEARRLIRRCYKVKEAVEKHGKFNDDPAERVGNLLLQMLSDKTLPNVMVGAMITTSINYAAGQVPALVPLLSALLTVASFGVYAIGDEIKASIKAMKNEVKEPDGIERAYR